MPVNVALIGFGYAGRTFHAPLIHAVEGLTLHTVVTSRPDEAGELAAGARLVATPEEAFADPAVDLVVIAAPNDRHAPLAIQALEAGKAVVVDKPFALDLAEARGVVEVAERTGRLLSVFHNRRWDADFLTLQALIAEGHLGRVARFESRFDRYRPEVRDRWREADVPGAGVWMDLGPHLIDQALRLFGPPRSVFAHIGADRDGAKADDAFLAVLDYDRLTVTLGADMLSLAGTPRLIVQGTGGGWIKHGLDAQEDAMKAGVRPGDAFEGRAWGADPRPGRLADAEGTESQTTGVGGDYRAYYAGVRDALLGSGPNPVPSAEALAVMAVIDAGRESARTGRAVAPVI
ncbi:oxidoreductase [Brevundimonas sp.]|uniref:oxidoreductase n=1 Tax=Brevundimonas sp. TaxID=1871086 RepID=UPI0035AE6543